MWLSIGALVDIIFSLLDISIFWQTIAFLIIGVVIISIGYPWAKKKRFNIVSEEGRDTKLLAIS